MKNSNLKTRLGAVALFTVLLLGASSAIAGPAPAGGHGKAMSMGQLGNASKVTRTIKIKMHDNYFEPKKIDVKAGETVRFVIANAGDFVHEFNIGTPNMHAAHQKEMMMMMQRGSLGPDKIDRQKMKMASGKTMQHEDSNSVLLEPGKTGEIIWKFTKADGIEFACNVPGHYDAGMVGALWIHH